VLVLSDKAYKIIITIVSSDDLACSLAAEADGLVLGFGGRVPRSRCVLPNIGATRFIRMSRIRPLSVTE